MESILSNDSTFLRLESTEITDEIQRKAELELHENRRSREECLKELKEIIKSEKNLKANTSDAFLLQFLRVKKFDTKIAFNLLKSYYAHKRSYSNLYSRSNLNENLRVMSSNLMNFLPLRHPSGCAVFVSRVGQWDPNVLDFKELLKVGILCQEKALQNPVTQICGIITVVDFKDMSWSHLFYISPALLRCFVSALQDCLPMRHKAIHVLNNSGIFAHIFAVIKPLLHRKIRERIYFHGDNMSSFHRFVPPAMLPKEYGGIQGPFGNEQFSKALIDSQEEFEANKTYGYINKR